MNEAMAKLTTFTRTTLTPMPAAERSLARTASMAEPSELVRSRATHQATTHERDQAEQAELEAGEGLAGADAEVEAEQRRAAHRAPLELDDLGVAEPHRLDRVRERERDHAEREPAQAQRRQADDDADDRGDQRREERRDRERDVPALGEVAERERRRRRPGRAGRARPGRRSR